MVCLECRAVLDPCWRWCPECGCLELFDPEAPAERVTPLAWITDDRFDDRPPVPSSA